MNPDMASSIDKYQKDRFLRVLRSEEARVFMGFYYPIHCFILEEFKAKDLPKPSIQLWILVRKQTEAVLPPFNLKPIWSENDETDQLLSLLSDYKEYKIALGEITPYPYPHHNNYVRELLTDLLEKNNFKVTSVSSDVFRAIMCRACYKPYFVNSTLLDIMDGNSIPFSYNYTKIVGIRFRYKEVKILEQVEPTKFEQPLISTSPMINTPPAPIIVIENLTGENKYLKNLQNQMPDYISIEKYPDFTDYVELIHSKRVEWGCPQCLMYGNNPDV